MEPGAYNNRGYIYMAHLSEEDKACRDWQKACELGSCVNYNKAKEQGFCKPGRELLD